MQCPPECKGQSLEPCLINVGGVSWCPKTARELYLSNIATETQMILFADQCACWGRLRLLRISFAREYGLLGMAAVLIGWRLSSRRSLTVKNLFRVIFCIGVFPESGYSDGKRYVAEAQVAVVFDIQEGDMSENSLHLLEEPQKKLLF